MTALIFDCDGVLADTERYGHLPGVQPDVRGVRPPGALVRGGVRREALDRRRQGAHGEPPDRRLRPRGGTSGRCRGPAAGRGRRGTAGRPRSTPRWSRRGVFRVARAWRASPERRSTRGGRSAVASTSSEASVRAVLEHVVGADRAARFALVLAGDVVPKKKPAPDIYELAISRLGCRASRSARDRGFPQRVARGGRRRPGVRRHGEQLHTERGLLRGGAGRVVARRVRTGRRPRCSRRGGYPPTRRLRRTRGSAGVSRRSERAGWMSERGGVDGGDRALSDVELVVRTIAQTAVDNEKYFGELDAVVGDGDFGYSMARGFELVLADFDSFDRDGHRDVPQEDRRRDHQPRRRDVRALVGDSVPARGSRRPRARPSSRAMRCIAMLRAAIEGIKKPGGTRTWVTRRCWTRSTPPSTSSRSRSRRATTRASRSGEGGDHGS